jgi:Ca2+-binding RTX toxin-like protein
MPAQIIDLGNLEPTEGFVILGDEAGDRLGFSASSAGDINGDGIDDLIVGAPNGSDGGTYAGEAYIVYGKAGVSRPPLDLTNFSPNDGFAIIGDQFGDLAGYSVSGAGDVNGDGIDDLIVGAILSDDGGYASGAAYVIFGKVGAVRASIDLTNLAASDGFVIIGDTAGDNAGRSVSSAGDINGDGFDDVIVGARLGDDNGTDTGEAYVIFGRAGSTRTSIDLSTLAASDGFIIRGDADSERGRAGGSVSSAGDINGDGIDDLIVGASGGDAGGTNAGEAYVIFGQTGANRANIDLRNLASSDGFVIQGDKAGDFAGTEVANAGDVNGDGIDDLIVGASGSDDGGADAGEAFVIFGKAGTTRVNIDLSSLAIDDGFIIRGNTAGIRAGASVSAAGDINGDGIDDLIVGAYRSSDGGIDAGAAYVVFGRSGASRAAIDLSDIAASDGLIIQGAVAGDLAGSAVSAAGDVNSDGIDDLIVTAQRGDGGGLDAGAVYIIFGSTSFGAAPPPFEGTSGNDILTGTTDDDIMRGLAGNDIYVVDSTGDRVEENANEGIDHIDTNLSNYTLPVNVENLEYTGASAFAGNGNALANYIVGGARGDSLSGMGGDDELGGEAGDDLLNGGEGSDRLIGGTGADMMNGENGNDRLIVDNAGDVAIGGAGIDTVQVIAAGLTYTVEGSVEIVSNHSGGALTITLNAFANTYGGSAGIDTVMLSDGQDSAYGRAGNDIFLGESGNDYLFGQEGDDVLDGGEGLDRLYGGSDGDALSGGAGNDILYGEAGTDTLTGDTGVDFMSGGAGADSFVFASGDSGATLAMADRIIDFSNAQGDVIDLSAIDAVNGDDDDAFAFIGSAAFGSIAGQLRTEVIGGNTYVQGDTNGDGVADFIIRLDGNVALSSGDFFL